MSLFLGLPKAKLRWSDAAEPEDITTGDVYFSADDGAKESQSVFLNACQLPARWQQNKTHVICELGFGTGLNFLVTLAKWRKTTKPEQILHYIAIEGYPMTQSEMKKAHSRFPEFSAEAKILQTNWPSPTKGFHTRDLGNQVSLTLLFGPAGQMLKQLEAKVDSWFLDGFAPAKNPEMWSEQVLAQMARLSAPAARVGTFSVAGFVRRGLSDVGFVVEKKPGHGRKRQRLEAEFTEPGEIAKPPAYPQKALVIGGGIAGACLANALTQANIKCVLIEKESVASGASGNPYGLVSPRLDLDDTPLARFYRTAFAYANWFYTKMCPDAFTQTDIRKLAINTEQQQKFFALMQAGALPPEQMELLNDGQELRINGAGILQPVKAVNKLVAQATIISQQIVQLIFKEGQWRALTANGVEVDRAPIIILATGCGIIDAPDIPKMRLLRGQISITNDVQNLPATPLVGQSYTVPIAPNTLLFGATHDRLDTLENAKVRQSDHVRNLDNLTKLDPELAAKIDVTKLTGRASVRAASPDMQPLAGPVPTAAICNWSREHWGKLDDYVDAPKHPGLFILNGLGSRGLTLAPLLAEEIVRQVTDAPSVLEKEVINALHPARFAARAARKKS